MPTAECLGPGTEAPHSGHSQGLRAQTLPVDPHSEGGCGRPVPWTASLRTETWFRTPVSPSPPQSQRAQQGPVAVGSAPTAVTKGLFWASVNIFSGPLSSAPSQETRFTLPPTRGPQEPHRDLMLRVPASLSQVPFQQPLLGQGPRLAI